MAPSFHVKSNTCKYTVITTHSIRCDFVWHCVNCAILVQIDAMIMCDAMSIYLLMDRTHSHITKMCDGVFRFIIWIGCKFKCNQPAALACWNNANSLLSCTHTIDGLTEQLKLNWCLQLLFNCVSGARNKFLHFLSLSFSLPELQTPSKKQNRNPFQFFG